jgi:subtilase family protein
MHAGDGRDVVRTLRRAAAGLVALSAIVVTTGAAPAGRAPTLELSVDAPPTLKTPKLDAALARIGRVAGAEGAWAAATRADALGLETTGTRVEVEITARDSGQVAAAIEDLGGSVQARYRGLLEALVPLGSLDELAARGTVRWVGRPARPQPAAIADEGVATTGADAWQNDGTSGKGVKVAIIDVGFRDWQAQQAGGELPAAVTTKNFCSARGFDGLDADAHGTAVAEIVHDMAPDARLYLVCVDSLAGLGQAKDYVVGKGIGIVNHSVGWYNTARGDGTGIAASPDGIVADARVHGILWVNSAGNDAQNHWTGNFVDTDANDWHEFDPGSAVTRRDEGNGVFLDTSDELCAYLKWDDWPASAQDYDLYLYYDNDPDPLVEDAVLVAWSTNLQSGTQPPTEALCYTNGGPLRSFDLAIYRDGATQTPRFDLFATTRPKQRQLQYNTTSGSLLEPASSPHVVTVGAACWPSTSLEPFSSQGPTIDGRTKPDLIAPDGVSSATYGPFAFCGANVGFFGTSASAPHVAGAAALLKQANPTFGPTELQTSLEASTTELGPLGKDNLYGSGLLLFAPGSAPSSVPPPPATGGELPTITGTPQQGQTLTVTTGTWIGGVAVYAYQWQRCNAAGAACDDISGALGHAYTAIEADILSTLRVEVTVINTGGASTAVSDPTAPVLPSPPAYTSPPTVGGRAKLADTLTASLGTWTGYGQLSYATDWRRCNAAGDACVSTGVKAQAYAVRTADVGATLRVAVTASNAGGSTTAVSAPSAVVPLAPPENVDAPTVTGAARRGVTLQASTGTWNGATSYAYRWWRCFETRCAYVNGATQSTYTLARADVGARLRFVVTASNAGGSTTASSAATAAVTAPRATRFVLVAGSVGHTRPVAGRVFTVRMRFARRPNGRAVPGRAVCTARIRGRALRVRRRTLTGGVVTCSWKLPPSAAGQRLSGSVRAAVQGLSVTRRFSVVVGASRPLRRA